VSEIRRIGGNMGNLSRRQDVKIVGAMPIDDTKAPEIRDRKSPPADPIRVEVVQHEEVVVEDDKVRRPKRDKTEPEVRVRHNDGSFQKAINDDET
jgi:hypothetical protein